jgi:hypothetical protein
MSFGEFETEYTTPGSVTQQRFACLAEMFSEFHPQTRPVLWQMLIVQAHIYKGFLHTVEMRHTPETGTAVRVGPMDDQYRQRFDWRQDKAAVSDREVLVQPFSSAQNLFEAASRRVV